MVDYEGIYGEYGRKYNDEDIVFQDGLLMIIQSHKVFEQFLSGGTSKPVSLKDISDKYPLTKMVIYESGSFGYIFRYMNHPENGWESVGRTRGYA